MVENEGYSVSTFADITIHSMGSDGRFPFIHRRARLLDPDECPVVQTLQWSALSKDRAMFKSHLNVMAPMAVLNFCVRV